jgi:hypothetical protein
MPGPLHYMHVMTREYLSSGAIRRMSLAAQGLYSTLRYCQWEDGCLPSDPSEICRMVGADRKEFDKAWTQVRALLVATDDCCLVFPDVAEQRLEAIAKVEKLAANGAKGGRPRVDSWKPVGNHKVSELESKSITSWEANTESESNREVSTPLGGSTPGGDPSGRVVLDEDRFETYFRWFKANYPKRGDGNYKWHLTKQRLRDALEGRRGTAGEIKVGLLAFKAFIESGRNADTEFVPLPSTWLNESGWLDEYPVILKAVDGGKAPTKTPEQMRAELDEKLRLADGGR